MVTFTLRARGSARPELAWERYVDTRLWSQWSPQINHVEPAGGPIITTGSTGSVIGPLGLKVQFVVDEVDEVSRTWAWQVNLGPIRLKLHHGVTKSGSGSSTWLRIAGPLPIIAAYAPIAQLALHRLLR